MTVEIVAMPLNIACPVCRAEIGEPCRGIRGSHQYRERDAFLDTPPIGELVRLAGDDRAILRETAGAAIDLAEQAGAPVKDVARLRKIAGSVR